MIGTGIGCGCAPTGRAESAACPSALPGESAGSPRDVEDPTIKTADIHAAAFLSALDGVDAVRISGLGVYALSGYMTAAVADDAADTLLPGASTTDENNIRYQAPY
ncbi:hypothetical protein [Aliiroseovarius sp.]|uniref:hypothetical protein n=1 Tax=Aliiroseovarius sp. TaxID=1872442 RepID=UPI003BA8B82D